MSNYVLPLLSFYSVSSYKKWNEERYFRTGSQMKSRNVPFRVLSQLYFCEWLWLEYWFFQCLKKWMAFKVELLRYFWLLDEIPCSKEIFWNLPESWTLEDAFESSKTGRQSRNAFQFSLPAFPLMFRNLHLVHRKYWLKLEEAT